MITINFITTWAQGIIVSVIIATIIEMILPEGNNSKYIKMVIGVFVLFTIISPVINKIKGKKANIDFDSYIASESSNSVATNANINNEKLIKQMYEENLKVDIKAKISQKGYVIGDLNVEILDNDEYTLNSIKMKVIGTSNAQNTNKNNSNKTTTIVENVENVLVNVSNGSKSDSQNKEKSLISESEKRKLRQYLSGIYEVKETNVLIN